LALFSHSAFFGQSTFFGYKGFFGRSAFFRRAAVAAVEEAADVVGLGVAVAVPNPVDVF
jgi:hypothetical protein